MGGVAVQVVKGDITKQTTDVIVNSSNDDFSLKTGECCKFAMLLRGKEMRILEFM